MVGMGPFPGDADARTPLGGRGQGAWCEAAWGHAYMSTHNVRSAMRCSACGQTEHWHCACLAPQDGSHSWRLLSLDLKLGSRQLKATPLKLSMADGVVPAVRAAGLTAHPGVYPSRALRSGFKMMHFYFTMVSVRPQRGGSSECACGASLQIWFTLFQARAAGHRDDLQGVRAFAVPQQRRRGPTVSSVPVGVVVYWLFGTRAGL